MKWKYDRIRWRIIVKAIAMNVIINNRVKVKVKVKVQSGLVNNVRCWVISGNQTRSVSEAHTLRTLKVTVTCALVHNVKVSVQAASVDIQVTWRPVRLVVRSTHSTRRDISWTRRWTQAVGDTAYHITRGSEAACYVVASATKQRCVVYTRDMPSPCYCVNWVHTSHSQTQAMLISCSHVSRTSH